VSEVLAALDELVAASRDLIIVRFRWVHQTGGKPTTDADMEAANSRHLEATNRADAALQAAKEAERE
jgi:hypothetical protein